MTDVSPYLDLSPYLEAKEDHYKLCAHCGGILDDQEFRRFDRDSIGYLMGHVRIDVETGCWEWQGSRSRTGYGTASLKLATNTKMAHRAMWEWAVGPIPATLTLDHLCRNRCCVNPLHLEPVSQSENSRRVWRPRKTA